MTPDEIEALVKRLSSRREWVLPDNWREGRKCPGCGYSAERSSCAVGDGGYCQNIDPEGFDPDPHVAVVDQDCAAAADALLALAAERDAAREKLAPWEGVIDRIMSIDRGDTQVVSPVDHELDARRDRCKALTQALAASHEREARLQWALEGPLGDVLLERERQVNEEGWSPQHDDTHVRDEMASAAACYAVPSRHRLEAFKAFWPSSWSAEWWKPAGAHDDLSARRRDLVKAAALIVAEMERIDRRLARAALDGEGEG